ENARLMGENYGDLYGPDTELGRWLRSKHAVVRIGEYVFCHGGISPELAESGVSFDEINNIARLYLGSNKSEWQKDLYARALYNHQTGIFWYRTGARGKLSLPQMQKCLDYASAKVMVVGHTLMPEIQAIYDGLMICIDLLHEDSLTQGKVEALLLLNGEPFVQDNAGRLQPVNAYLFSERD
ncbi:MAG: hypothetical protein ACK4NS_12895, partial [Saprospiraceae bacterium]